MATPSQIAANRENSKKSSGPKTSEGKAKSCLNHLSHGFTSNTSRLIPGENPEEFKALLADLMDEYQPATPTEQILVERMTLQQWLTLRAFRFQTESFIQAFERQKPVNANLALFIRYQATADRAFHTAHGELIKAQKQREKSEIDFDSQEAARIADNGQRITDDVPKTVPITPLQTDSPAAPAASAAPDARSLGEIAPEAPKSLKKAA